MFIRAFIAVAPPEEVLDAMEIFLFRLRPMSDYKWVNRSQLHLTIRFLGEISPEVFDGIKIRLENVRIDPFRISLDYSGAFPGYSRTKVLWISGKTGSEELKRLADQTEQIAISAGLEPEKKKFSPHLTIARTRTECNIPEKLIQAMKDTPSFSWECKDFVLMQSQLTPRGPIYTMAKRYLLQK